jgi:hypothetical protein
MLNADHNSRVRPLCNSESGLDAERCCKCNFLFLPNPRSPLTPSKEGVFVDYDLERLKGLKTTSSEDMHKKKK